MLAALAYYKAWKQNPEGIRKELCRARLKYGLRCTNRRKTCCGDGFCMHIVLTKRDNRPDASHDARRFVGSSGSLWH